MKRESFLEYGDFTPPSGNKRNSTKNAKHIGKNVVTKEREKTKKLKKHLYDPEFDFEEFYE